MAKNEFKTRHANLIGERFGKWTVDSWLPTIRKWRVVCDCGYIGCVETASLKRGNSTQCRNCGDISSSIKRIIHNKTRTRLYNIWKNMLGRCNNQNRQNYKRYGGRGIIVCDEWRDFRNFNVWAIANGYKNDLQIDRIDNNGNYCPENCRWVTNKENANNTRNNRIITLNGISKTLQEWADETQINRKTISDRIDKGWTIERALTEKPFRGKNQFCKRGDINE